MTKAVVKYDEVEPGIIQITIEDRVHKNTFSEGVISGLQEAYRFVDENPRVKAVVLTGYDSYFATGGTKDELLALQEGKMKFTDINIYRLALDCKVPVIAAMQGHSLGGGLVLGLFCDFVVMSRESIYSANFMKYGFTPGMGATYILPQKLGVGLAHEMLLNANSYRGEELKNRGIAFPVVPRNEVLEYAFKQARDLADKPQKSLITLKNHLTSGTKKDLPAIIDIEEQMHRQTIHEEEVKQRVNALF